jgi:pimeloyl-ACP methyl ester carboxylesterase
MTFQIAVSIDGNHIAYDRTGSGPALMLLHGGGGSRQDWYEEGYVAHLMNDFTTITVDLRGHGESDKPADPPSYSTAKISQDLLSVADACGFGGFILCGYSLGGNVSRYLAAKSERVTKLIMIGNPLGPGVSGEWRRLALYFRTRWAPVVHAKDGPFDPRLLPIQDQQDIQQLSFPAELLPSILALSTAMLDWPVVKLIDLHCPTLWLFGSENKTASQSFKKNAKSIQKANFTVRILQGLTHPQEFSEIDQILSAIYAFTQL